MQITGLCTVCPIMWKNANYVHAQLHIPLSLALTSLLYIHLVTHFSYTATTMLVWCQMENLVHNIPLQIPHGNLSENPA